MLPSLPYQTPHNVPKDRDLDSLPLDLGHGQLFRSQVHRGQRKVCPRIRSDARPGFEPVMIPSRRRMVNDILDVLPCDERMDDRVDV
jgi:hypothetical protein